MRIAVRGIPGWVDAERLLGPGFSPDGEADLSVRDAADVAARLRGVGLGGRLLTVEADLPRAAVRAARTEDARRRRETTPGFLRSGTRLDAEGRMSLTPEAIALKMVHDPPKTVVDAGCGCGGNSIAFARKGCRVVAVEQDAARLEMAAHNARIYGVADRIRFVHGDARDHLGDGELVFADPPWGADWSRERTVAADFPLLDAIRSTPRWWAKVPPSFDPSTTPEARPEAWFGEATGDRRRVKFVLLRAPAEQQ